MERILVSQVSKSYDQKEVLKKVSFHINEGEIFGLLGPSGAGKTTIIKILTGQLAYSGTAKIMGKSCDKTDRSIYDAIGMVMDNCGLYDRLSCLDNMLLFARLHGVPKHAAGEILDHVGLTDKKVLAGRLSKGMKQRLLLARALLHKPKILFLDEPTSGLDPATASQIHRLLLGLKQNGTTILLTTHNMVEAHKLCDHVALLNDGCIVEYGTVEDLCRKYNTENSIVIVCKDGRSLNLPNQPKYAEEIAQLIADDNVLTMHSSEPNLETVFMTLTGKELDL